MNTINFARNQRDWLPHCEISVFFDVNDLLGDPVRLELKTSSQESLASSAAECIGKVSEVEASCGTKLIEDMHPAEFFHIAATRKGLQVLRSVFRDVLTAVCRRTYE